MYKIKLCGLMLASCSFVVDSQAKPSESLRSITLPIDIGMSALFAAGGASVGEKTLHSIQSGGHDPKKLGFNLQNLELSIGGAVDPYFDAQTNIIMLFNEEGESLLEIEEAFLVSKRIPANFQLKAGQYYTEFGRQNRAHPHTWSFVDQPIIASRALGADGLRSQGVQLSWLSPLPWYAEIFFGVQNAKGSTGTSFLGEDHEEAPEEDLSHEEFERTINGLEDFIYSARLLNGMDIIDSVSANFGLSILNGPNRQSEEARTAIYGLDFYLKWLPEHSQRGYPFITWHSEFVLRDFELAIDDHDKSLHAPGYQKDQGWFNQLSIGFKPSWVAGYRFENAWSNSEENTASVAERLRTSINLTWYASEFSKIRLQYNFDQSKYLDEDVHSIWLQFEYNLGSHPAHVF